MCGSEAFAPLGTAAFEHELPAFGAHSNAEAMSLGAPAVVGLKSPLHGLHLSISISAEKGKAIGSTGCCQGERKSRVLNHFGLVWLALSATSMIVEGAATNFTN